MANGTGELPMTTRSSSLFPIHDADEYICSIYKYEIGHSGLYLKVSNHREPPFYLYFAGVEYFSGPPSWQGVNFLIIENAENRIGTLRSISYFAKWSENKLLERLQVYKVNKPSWDVIIVAVEVQKVDNVSGW